MAIVSFYLEIGDVIFDNPFSLQVSAVCFNSFRVQFELRSLRFALDHSDMLEATHVCVSLF